MQRAARTHALGSAERGGGGRSGGSGGGAAGRGGRGGRHTTPPRRGPLALGGRSPAAAAVITVPARKSFYSAEPASPLAGVLMAAARATRGRERLREQLQAARELAPGPAAAASGRPQTAAAATQHAGGDKSDPNVVHLTRDPDRAGLPLPRNAWGSKIRL